MARPDAATAAGIERRRDERLKLHAEVEGRKAEAAAQITAIAEGQAVVAAARPADELPTLPDLIRKLEAAYVLALQTAQPGPATNAVMAMGRLLGFVVERSAVAVQHVDGPLAFDEDEKTFARVRDEHGEAAEKEFRRFVSRMAKLETDKANPMLIEGEVTAAEAKAAPERKRK